MLEEGLHDLQVVYLTSDCPNHSLYTDEVATGEMLLAVSIAYSGVADSAEHRCDVLAAEGTFMRL